MFASYQAGSLRPDRYEAWSRNRVPGPTAGYVDPAGGGDTTLACAAPATVGTARQTAARNGKIRRQDRRPPNLTRSSLSRQPEAGRPSVLSLLTSANGTCTSSGSASRLPSSRPI